MIGQLNAPSVKKCLKRGVVLKLLDWVACVCDFADIVTASNMQIYFSERKPVELLVHNLMYIYLFFLQISYIQIAWFHISRVFLHIQHLLDIRVLHVPLR